jgi:ribosomal protein L32E
MVKSICERAHSSAVEQFPLKEKVDGSNPSGLTRALLIGSYADLEKVDGPNPSERT